MPDYSSNYARNKGTMELMKEHEIKFPDKVKQMFQDSLMQLNILKERIQFAMEH